MLIYVSIALNVLYCFSGIFIKKERSMRAWVCSRNQNEKILKDLSHIASIKNKAIRKKSSDSLSSYVYVFNFIKL